MARLLIVDDEPVLLDLLSGIFDEDPWEVVTASDGASAREAILSQAIDVLLTDKNLPDASGLDLIRLHREHNPSGEALLITGYASLETALTAMQLGVFDYIVKPPKDIFDVRRKVAQAFEKQRLVCENRRLVEDLRQKNRDLEVALDEVRATQAELVQAEKLAGIGTLAAGIAHEISSPLFGVMGLAEAIQEEDQIELVHQYATDIVEYSKNIKEIVVGLSGYSRAAKTEFDVSVDLTRVIDDAVRLVTRSTPGADHARIAVHAESPVWVRGRATELQQVFVNLVKNAIEAVTDRPEYAGGGEVRVICGGSDGGAWAKVSDDGPGIEADKLPVLFDPFYTTKAPGKGTGLGLNIVYRILTRYRGTISVDSVVGEGTTFTVKLPAAPPAP